jgi:hypothetical protein
MAEKQGWNERAGRDDAQALSQLPSIGYHDAPSTSSIATDDSAFSADEPLRKRFKAPRKCHLLDREAGNVRPSLVGFGVPTDSPFSARQPKPWMKGRTTITRDARSYWTTLFGIFLGVGGGVALILHSCLAVDHNQYSLLFEDNFEGSTLNESHWKVEERIGGGESVRRTSFHCPSLDRRS